MLSKSKFCTIIILSILITSCSSDDDGDIIQPEISANLTISYIENQTDNSPLGSVQASDNDEIIGFSIASGNTDNFFSIDDSGAISLTDTGLNGAANDYEVMPNEFILGIIAEDASGNLSDVVDVTLQVNDDEQDNFNYFPLVVDNNWDYTNTTTTDTGFEVTNETMSINTQEMVNDTLFFEMQTNSTDVNLTTTSILSSSELFKKDNQLQAKGQFDNLGQNLPGGISLPIQTNLIPIYSTNAGANAQLFSESGNFTETVEGVDLEIDFTLSSQNAGTMESMQVNGITYNNIIASSIVLNMKITANLVQGGIPISFTILNEQDVLTATHYFANEEGMIKSEVVVAFDFQDIPDFDLPDINSNTLQELQSSNVSLP